MLIIGSHKRPNLHTAVEAGTCGQVIQHSNTTWSNICCWVPMHMQEWVCNVKIRGSYNPNNPKAKFSTSVAVSWRGAGHCARSTADLQKIPELSKFEKTHAPLVF